MASHREYSEEDEEETTDYSSSDSFFLGVECEDGPVIAAAGLADPADLVTLLGRAESLGEQERERWVVNQVHGFRFASPLLRAIERQRLKNVRLLLDNGADPNGISKTRQADVSRRFRRFYYPDDRNDMTFMEVPVHDDAVGSVPSQTHPPSLLESEIEERRSNIAPFFTEPINLEVDHSQSEAVFNAVVMTARSTPEILDVILDAGADTCAWRQPLLESLPEEGELRPSELSISTPLHAAIVVGNMGMLHRFLAEGVSPNARAIVTGSQALTPFQYAVVLGNTEVNRLLKEQGADPNTLTPVFGVHVLHFASAQLDVDLLKSIDLPLSVAQCTSVRHLLLHTACLPFNDLSIRLSAPKIKESIHDIRGMQAKYPVCLQVTKTWDDYGEEDFVARDDFKWPLPANTDLPLDRQYLKAREWPRDPYADTQNQEATCKFIIDKLGSDAHVGMADKHGNTPLHYLAAASTPNNSLIDWLLIREIGKHTWHDARNWWGHTPQDLLEDKWAAQACE